VLKVLDTTAVTKMVSCLPCNYVGKFLQWVYFVNRVLSNVNVYIEMVKNQKLYLIQRLYVLNVFGMKLQAD
jgi:hypothetical protein